MNANLLWSRIKDNHLEELIRGALGFLSVKLLGAAVNLLFIYIVTQWYGASIMGIYSISFAVLQIAILYGKIGLDNALLRFIAAYSAKNQGNLANHVYLQALKSSTLASLGISAIVFFAAPFLAQKIFHNQVLVTPLRICAVIVLPSAIAELNASYLRGLKYIKSFSFILNVSVFLFGCIILAAGKPFLERTAAPVIAFAFATVITLLISFILIAVVKNIKTETKAAESYMPVGELLKVAFPMLLTGSYMLILSWTGSIALGIFGTDTDVGIYHVVLKIASFIIFTLTSINSIAASKFSECFSTGDMEGFRKVTRYTGSLVFWTTVPLGIIFLFFPKTIAGFFGKEITGGVTALLILIVGYFVNAMCGSVGVILNMTGHHVVYQKIVLFSAVINIILNIILIPVMGINGAAIANTAGMIVWNVASAVYIKKKFDINSFYIPFV